MMNEALMRKCAIDFLERFCEPAYLDYKERQNEIEEIISKKPDVDKILSNFAQYVETEDGVETVVISSDVIRSTEKEVEEHIQSRDRALSLLSDQVADDFKEELDKMFEVFGNYYEIIEQEEIYIVFDSWLSHAQTLKCENAFIVHMSKWLSNRDNISAASLEANPATHALLMNHLFEYKNPDLFEKLVSHIDKKKPNKEIKTMLFSVALKMNDSYPKAIEVLQNLGQIDFADLGVFEAMGLTKLNTAAQVTLDKNIRNFIEVMNALEPQLKDYFNRKESEKSLEDFYKKCSASYHPAWISGAYSNLPSSSPESTRIAIEAIKAKVEKSWTSYIGTIEVIERFHLNKKLAMDVKPVSQPSPSTPGLVNRF